MYVSAHCRISTGTSLVAMKTKSVLQIFCVGLAIQSLACTRNPVSMVVRDSASRSVIDDVHALRIRVVSRNPLAPWPPEVDARASDLPNGTATFSDLRADEVVMFSKSGYASARVQLDGNFAYVESPVPAVSLTELTSGNPIHEFDRSNAHKTQLSRDSLDVFLVPKTP